MKRAKRKRLERQGWKVGDTDELLQLSKEESRTVRLELARRPRQSRRERRQ